MFVIHKIGPRTVKKMSRLLQSSITDFVSGGEVSEKPRIDNESSIDEISKKLDKVLAIVSPREAREKTISCPESNPSYQNAKNLREFLDLCPDMEIVENMNKPGKELRCKVCSEYLDCKPGISLKSTASRRPSGKDAGCLSTRLNIDDTSYQSFAEGGNQKWYRFKKTLLDHLLGIESKTHTDDAAFLREIAPTKLRGRRVIKTS